MNVGMRGVVLGLVLVAAGVTAMGQGGLGVGSVSGTGSVPATISGIQYTLGNFPMYTQGQPFVAMETRTLVKTLDDETHSKMTNTSMERAFRDSLGRFRLESGEMKDGEWKVRLVQIFDPVALTSVSFMVGSKTARLTHVQARKERTPEEEAKMAAQRARSEAFRKEHPEMGGEESLGAQVMLGEVVEGTRHTSTTRAAEGRPAMTMVREMWTSPELRIPLLMKMDHPLIGHETWTVTELKRVEPEASLFKLPDGYKVVEQMRPQFELQ